MCTLNLFPRLLFFKAGLLILLLATLPAPAQVILSEFLATSASTNTDDWIEIYNASNATVNLEGWHLTDTATNLTRWTFPSTNLPAGEFLLVYASGQDLTTPVLHANFSLSANREYLALVRPDGTTIEHEYAPAYPAQFPDITFGIQTHGTNPTLRAEEAGFLIRRTPGTTNSCLPAPHPLYSGDSVAQIDLAISQSGWDALMNDPWNESFQSANVRFRHGDIDITVTNVGIQCRGNTSRDKQPRSFNIAFNTFVPGQQLLDMERLNLNGDANDPSMARPRLLNDLHNQVGLPTSYANHVALVVHGPNYDRGNWVGGLFFDAVRNNTQPVDDVFLEQRFGTSRGNLYKCNNREWQASLEYRGPTGASYIGNGTTYELKHDGSGDTSYNDLAAFVGLVNTNSDANFPNAIMNAFDVDGFLKRMALDVLTGNWDDYWSNANNYHLFLHPETRRWVYIPYDFDNAMGIHWDSVDWARQNIYNWANYSGSTPLATRIFAVPEFKKRYTFYMKQMLDTVYSNSVLNPLLFHARSTMTNALPFETGSVIDMKARERQRYGGDWPYWTYGQFFYSYVDAQSQYNFNAADSYGVTNFISVRSQSARSQLDIQNIAPILSDFAMVPSLPRTNDAVVVSIRALDDVAITNVSIFYTFQGGVTNVAAMPLQADGSYAASLPAFGATGTVRYLIRALDNTGKSTFHPYGGAAYAATVEIGSAAFDLVLTELNYNPYLLTAPEIAAGLSDKESIEFVELHNAGNSPMDLTGFKIQDGITATFPAFTLGIGEYAVVVKNTNAFRIRYTNSAIRIIGTYSGQLSNGGETLRLENASGGVIASLTYSDSGAWPGRADGDGSTLEIINATVGYADPTNWRSSSEYGGSPGTAGQGPDNRVVINEVLTHTDPPLCDSIELYNTTAGAINIGGWCLSDAKSNYMKYAISGGTILPAGGYVVFNATNHFNAGGGTSSNDFLLDGAHGDEVYLVEANAQGRPVRFVDHVEFGATANGESIGRWPNGSGRGCPMLSRTFGAANSSPRVGPLVISEIMYNPPSTSNHLEFVEIANPTALPVDLTRWQLDEGISFTFTNGLVIPAGGAFAVLSFDPNAASNSALLAEFLSTYELSNATFLVGGYSNTLAHGGERIRLLHPDDPPAEEPTFYPLMIEDETAYDNELPWPIATDGGGASLARQGTTTWGDDSTSWAAAVPPTPGSNGDPIPTYNLTIGSAHGLPSPSVGTHAIAIDTALSNSVPSPEIIGGVRYLCTGWTLASNSPASGSTNWMLMTLTNDATLTWLWNTNFSLSVSIEPGGSVQPGSGWYTLGTTVELQATASNDFAFAGWTGNTNAIVAGNATSTTISVQMDSPVSLTAQFDALTPTYYVSPSGSHTAPYTTWGTASTSLQAIVDFVPATATVLVAAATYPLTSQLSINKALLIKSQDGPASTFLDGGNSTRVLFLSHSNAIVEGFTLQRGNSGSSSGGGARIEPGGQMFNCIIRSNTTQKSGGGIALLGDGELRNCLVYGNSANSERGGGVYTYTVSGAPLIQNCTFSLNSANEGGGAYLLNAAVLLNSIVWNNSASSGSNIVLSGLGHTLQSNTTNASPQFIAAAATNFRLATNSPCIDAATNQSWMATATDLDGRPRIIHNRADIGAYEVILSAWDSDTDGLPDAWEWDYSHSLVGMDPTAHDDNDQLTNFQEYLAGTDPFDGNSFLGIQSTAKGTVLPNTFVMSWASVTGRNYRITFSTNIISPFSFVAYSNISADPPANTFTGTLSQPDSAFYRIELE